jgi:hypothetical protein
MAPSKADSCRNIAPTLIEHFGRHGKPAKLGQIWANYIPKTG